MWTGVENPTGQTEVGGRTPPGVFDDSQPFPSGAIERRSEDAYELRGQLEQDPPEIWRQLEFLNETLT
jgi:hypothetical protein